MALTSVAYPDGTGQVGVTDAANFIPEIWSDEIVAAYESNLVVAPLVKKLQMTGKKGDTIHIPAPTRGVAALKAENTAVTIQADTEAKVDVSITRHFEYSRMIEDIVNVQGLASLRRFYTEDAGYALAKQKDTDLLNCGTGLGDGTYTAAPTDGAAWENTAVFYNDGTSGLIVYENDVVAAADFIQDDAFRSLIQKMDDADVPMDNRSFIVPPVVRNDLMGIDRYVSSDFVNTGRVANGLIGNLYGVDVYVSTNCPTMETAAQNAAGGVIVRACSLIHRDTYVCAEQMNVRSQMQYKQEYLADLYTADNLYGVANLRTTAGFILAVPDGT